MHVSKLCNMPIVVLDKEHLCIWRCAAQALQSSMADGGNALGSMQRLVEERTQQASTAQQALMHLQQDHARLNANLRTAQEQAASRSDHLQNSLSPCVSPCLSSWACMTTLTF